MVQINFFCTNSISDSTSDDLDVDDTEPRVDVIDMHSTMIANHNNINKPKNKYKLHNNLPQSGLKHYIKTVTKLKLLNVIVTVIKIVKIMYVRIIF